jgi:hypothetical protein
MTTDAPFADLDQLSQAFALGLRRLLQQDKGMGAFILVLANAQSDAALQAALADELRQRFAELATECRAQLSRGESLSAPADDLLVFLKLMALGLEQLPMPRQRQVGPWQLQFNLLRSLRPERAGGEAIVELMRPFNPAAFHFNKPFLASETFWRGEFLGKTSALLYNKFPFMPLHGLWVPEPERELPQFLLPELHQFAWAICRELGTRLPGLGLGYNSLGAGASINQFHLQLFVAADLPLERAQWSHLTGEKIYPLDCRRFDQVDAAWAAIEQCHQQNRAYNILYRDSVCYLIRRRFQGQFQRQLWLSALGWSELCGCFTLFNQQQFRELAAESIEQQLSALGLD